MRHAFDPDSEFTALFCGLKARRITAQGKGACAAALGYGIKTYSRPVWARPYGTAVCDRFLPCGFGIRVYKFITKGNCKTYGFAAIPGVLQLPPMNPGAISPRAILSERDKKLFASVAAFDTMPALP